MAQAGIHGIVGAAAHKWAPKREWLMLGVVLGNILPDADNLAVAVATLTGLSTEGLHRTFTHSLFFVATIVILFEIIGRAVKRPRWQHLGWGLGAGILMHVLLDLVVWFNGVEILWPIPSWINLWEGYTPAEWWSKLMMPVEFLFFALFFILLRARARERGEDDGWLDKWIIVQGVLFVVFTPLVYTMEKGFMTPFGALYLLSLGLAWGVTIRMRATVDGIA
jgi:membrane-bound metal-dependent hydrolase YbcI (DUF457 family)